MLGVFHHWWLPILSGVIWWAMLISLLSIWGNEGNPNYSWMNKPQQKILYISDIAGNSWKAQSVFIGCAATQGAFFVLSLASERWLRHLGRLRPNHRTAGKVLSGFSIGWAVIGELGILFVSIFNTRKYHEQHAHLLVVFIVFLGLSALSSVAEYFYLDIDHQHKRHIIVSLSAKICWFLIELVIAIAFVCTIHTNINASAVLEWMISFVYPFYSLVLAYDLWPAYNKKKGHYPKYNEFSKYPADPDQVTLENFSDSTTLDTYHEKL